MTNNLGAFILLILTLSGDSCLANKWAQCSHSFCSNRGICNAMSSSISALEAKTPSKFFVSPSPTNFSEAENFCANNGGGTISADNEWEVGEGINYLKGIDPIYFEDVNVKGVWIGRSSKAYECYVINVEQLLLLNMDCEENENFVALCARNIQIPINSSEHLVYLPSCQCGSEYGYRDCAPLVADEDRTHCYNVEKPLRLGDPTGSKIIFIDHAIFGRPLLNSAPYNLQTLCDADLYANEEEDVCVMKHALSALKYWCQGKKYCEFYPGLLSYRTEENYPFVIETRTKNYPQAARVCALNYGNVFQPTSLQDLIDLESIIYNRSDVFGVWIHDTSMINESDLIWFPSDVLRSFNNTLCYVLVNPLFGIDIRQGLTEKVVIQRRFCRRETADNILPACSYLKTRWNDNADEDCWKGLHHHVLEIRFHMEPDLNNIDVSCPSGADYRRGNTCYKKTLEKGDWWTAREECWLWGGDLAFPLPESGDCGARIVVPNREELWIASSNCCGNETRCPSYGFSPFFEEGTYDTSNDLCFAETQVDNWCVQMGKCRKKLRGLCSLPPISSLSINTSTAISTSKFTPSSTFSEQTSAEITDTSPAPSFCPPVSPQSLPQWPYPDYSWDTPGTPGNIDSQPCPEGQDGNVYWECGLSGNWEGYPDFSGCKGLDLSDDIDSIESGQSVPSEILDDVWQETMNSPNIGTGDINTLVEILDLALKLQKEQMNNGAAVDPYNYSKKYTLESAKLIDSILNKSTSWFGMPTEKTKEGINRIQNNVDDFTKEFLKYGSSSEEEDFKYSNIVLRVKKKISESYTFETHQSKITLSPKSTDSELNVVFQAFPNIKCIINKKFLCQTDDSINSTGKSLLGSIVMGASLFQEEESVQSGVNVALTFNNIFEGDNITLYNQECVFWDTSLSDWSSKGCVLREKGQSYFLCECDHLTNFGVIMDFNGILANKETTNKILRYITLIGCTLSIVSLIICLFIFTVVLKKNGERTIIHTNLCLSLLLGEIVLMSGLDAVHSGRIICSIISGLIHFFFLSAFFWMLLEGVNIYLKLVKVFDSGMSHIKTYYSIGYGIPLFIVILSSLISEYVLYGGYISDTFCWLNYKNGAIWFFNGPVLSIVIVNGSFYILALRIAQSSIARRGEAFKIKTTMLYFRGSTSLLCVLGLTWIFGFAFFAEGFVWVVYIFTFLNSLQGTFIFIFHVALNEKARHETRKYFEKNYYIQKWVMSYGKAFNAKGSSSSGARESSTQEITMSSSKSVSKY